jgi:hypothetical protein
LLALAEPPKADLQCDASAWHHVTMPKRISKAQRPTDVNQWAHALVNESTQEDNARVPATREQISALMAEMGRKGGKIGGKRRMETMTPAARKRAAKKAAEARWHNRTR